MHVDWTAWELSAAERQKFDTWMATIMQTHTGTRDARNQQLAWTPLTKPLSESVVTLFTTGGVHCKADQPFGIDSAHGDWTRRLAPSVFSVGRGTPLARRRHGLIAQRRRAKKGFWSSYPRSPRDRRRTTGKRH